MKPSKPKKIQGEVISRHMQKTAVVKVVLPKAHPKYHKRYTVTKHYQAHDEKNEYQVGDMVELEENRPISKEKRWRVARKIK